MLRPKKITLRALCVVCRWERVEKATANAVQNIPIAKPCVYTSIRIFRGIPCFRLTAVTKFEALWAERFSLSH